ncbi:nucleoside diphosphate-linked moiety X motif 17 isoform X2 [Rhineura floridana]|uniref:nucleoside diphosphate-linked moiety X motif 17 isoform X2 n=1 Tax=Rhineura floridana TaxID=261503 RepID=UPI002AC83EB2|nr:nucleoside diphosphate-linked moiety X motif 17 isoform X2 [Rhineura floridana]
MPFLRGARRMATGLAPRLPSRASREGLPRVRVYLSKEKSRPQRATFPQSIAGHFCAAEEDSWMVNCGLDQHRFLISDREFPGSNRVLLQRPSFCPIKHLSEAQVACLPLETRERGVDVGVAILLQSANQKVLLTRRSKHLNIFPNIWVPPGGHIEPDEQLLDAGLRELREETGLCLQDREFSWRMLALWESVFPPVLSRGLPERHHVVVYLLVLSHQSHQQLQAGFKADEAEVSAYTWLEAQVLASIAATREEVGGTRKMVGDLPPAVSIMELQHGSAKTVAIPTTTFLNSAPARGEDVERVSTGTKFALQRWLDTLAEQAQ